MVEQELRAATVLPRDRPKLCRLWGRALVLVRREMETRTSAHNQ